MLITAALAAVMSTAVAVALQRKCRRWRRSSSDVRAAQNRAEPARAADAQPRPALAEPHGQAQSPLSAHTGRETHADPPPILGQLSEICPCDYNCAYEIAEAGGRTLQVRFEYDGDDEKFREKYKGDGFPPAVMADLLHQLAAARSRRMNRGQETERHRKLLEQRYNPLDRDIRRLRPHHDIVFAASVDSPQRLRQRPYEVEPNRIYVFPVLSETYCQRLVHELDEVNRRLPPELLGRKDESSDPEGENAG